MTSTGLTTVELLDRLERRIGRLAEKLSAQALEVAAASDQKPAQAELHWGIPALPPDPAEAHEMRVLMQLAGLTQAAFAASFQVPVPVVREWLAGDRGMPVWVLPVLRLLGQLPPTMQQQAFRRQVQPAGMNRKRNTHPFARIEEL